VRRAAALLVPVALVVGAAGCASAPGTTTVSATTETTTVAVGGTLVVDLGTINTSVGDAWTVAVEPDPAVLGPGRATTTPQGKEGETGGYSALTYSFEAVAPGRTTIELQYAFRGSTVDADVLGKVERPRTRLAVTVE